MKTILTSVACCIFLLYGNPSTAQTNGKINGIWQVSVETTAGSGSPTFNLKQPTDSTIEGTYQGQLGESDVKGTIKGNKFHITFEISGNLIEYDGELDGDTIKGKVKLGSMAEGTFTGSRKK